MTDYSSVARGVWLVFGVLLLLATFRFAWLPSLADQLRHTVFCLRRELFLLMADGKLQRTDPVYSELRNSMNTLLRFAERMTPFRIVTVGFMLRERAWALSERRHALIVGVSDQELQDRLRSIDLRMGAAALHHAMLVSPLTCILLAVALVSLLVVRGVGGFVSFWRTLPRRVVSSEIAAELIRNNGLGIAA